jgi:hypothetical protein
MKEIQYCVNFNNNSGWLYEDFNNMIKDLNYYIKSDRYDLKETDIRDFEVVEIQKGNENKQSTIIARHKLDYEFKLEREN